MSCLIISSMVLTNISYAQEVAHIVPDGGTNTTVDRSQNGTPVVNIANASPGGVSRNTFRDFNVLNDNAVLNNFKGEAGVSKLGGALYGNPHFNVAGGRTASIILTEITSNRITRLEGYAEIFGDRAALIIANPNGIQVSGAGFINTSRLSLITGRPNINPSDGSIENFNIDPNAQISIIARNVNGIDANGNNIIIPLGLDASTTNYSEIISRVVKVSGQVYGGSDFNIKTGNHKYDYNTKEITSNLENLANKPEISIDGSAFGSMYAGRISFTSTEEGVGVKMVGGNLVSTFDDVNISSSGNIEFDNILAENDISIESSSGKITQNKSSYAKNNATFDAKQEIDINGDYLRAGKIATLTTLNSSINNKSNKIRANDIIIRAKNLNNQNSVITSDRLFDVDVAYFNNTSGVLKSSFGGLDDIFQNILRITGLTNSSETNFVNDDGLILVDGNLSMTSTDKITNSSVIKAANNLSISAKEVENKDTANQNYLISDADPENGVEAIYQSKGLIAGNNLDITTDSLDNENGYLKSGNNTTITIENDNDFDIKGIIEAANSLSINANNITNHIKLGKAIQDITLTAAGDIENSLNSEITAQKNLALNSNNLKNYGVLSAKNTLNIIAQGNIDNGKITDEDNNNLDLDPTNDIIARIIGGTGENTILSADGYVKNYGKISAVNNLTITTKKSVDDGGDSGISNYGQIAAGNDLTLDSKTFIKNIGNNTSLGIINDFDITSEDEMEELQKNLAGDEEITIKDINDFFADGALADDYELDLPDYIKFSVNGNVKYIKTDTIENLGEDIKGLQIALNSGSSSIFALNNMQLLADDYIKNYYSQIWAGKNIQMQKSSAPIYNPVYDDSAEEAANLALIEAAKNNSITNTAGSIQSYGGDITLLTKVLTNEKGEGELSGFDREFIEFVHKDTSDNVNDISYIHKDNYGNTLMSYEGTIPNSHYRGGKYFSKGGYHASLNLSNAGHRLNDGYIITIGGLTWPDHRSGINRKTRLFLENPNLIKSVIDANNRLNVYADTITNDASKLVSGGEMLLKGNVLNNWSYNINSKISYRCHYRSEWCTINGVGGLTKANFNFSFDKSTGEVGSLIIAGGKLKGSFINRIDNKSISEDKEDSSVSNKEVDTTYYNSTADDYNDYDNNINLPKGNFGLFKRTSNPNGKYLYETNVDFIDLDKFLGSNYFLKRLGINPIDIDTRRLGDSFYEQRKVIERIQNINNHDYLEAGITNDNEQMRALYDNAIDISLNDENFEIGKELTQEQVNNLDKDILWLVEEEVGGEKVLVNKLYLSNATQEKIKSKKTPGSLIKGEEVLLAAGVINSEFGTIKSESGDILLLADDINLKNSVLISGKNIEIASKNKVNLSNDLNFQDALSGKFRGNSASKSIQDFAIYKAANDIKVTGSDIVINNNNIEAEKGVTLIAQNNIDNIASTVKAGEYLEARAGNNINNTSQIQYVVNDKSATKDQALSSGDDRIKSNVMGRGNLISDGDVVLVAGNDINIVASNITTTGKNSDFSGDIHLEATNGNVNVTTDIIRNTVPSKSTHNLYVKAHNKSLNDAKSLGSKVNSAGSLTIVSGKDTVVTGRGVADLSEITSLIAKGDLKIDSGNNIDLIDSHVNSEKNITLNAGNDISNIRTKDNINESRVDAGESVAINAGNDFNNIGAVVSAEESVHVFAGNNINNEALITRTINGESATREEVDNSNADNIRSTLHAQAEIIANRNLVMIAGNNVNNVASNIINTGTQGNSPGHTYIEATRGNVNIVTDTLRDRTVRRWYSKKNRGVSIKDSTKNIGSNVDVAGDLIIVSGKDTKIKGSSLLVGKDLTTDSTGNLDIESAQDTEYSFYANYKRGSFGRRSSSTSKSNKITNISSNINVGGNINATSEENIRIIASSLTSNTGNINLVAKDQINILSASDISELETTSKKHGVTTTAINNKITKSVKQVVSNIKAESGSISLASGGNMLIVASQLSSAKDTDIMVGYHIDKNTNEQTINDDATLNILGAKDSEYSYEYSSKIGADFAAVVVGAVAAMAVTVATGGAGLAVAVSAAGGAATGAQAQKGNIDIVEAYDESIVSSNIKIGGNLNVNTASDINLISSNIEVGKEVNINAGQIIDKNNQIVKTNESAELNIASLEEVHTRSESHEKMSANYLGVAAAAAIKTSLGMVSGAAFGVVIAPKMSQKTNKSSLNTREVKNVSSTITAGKSINLSASGDVDIIGSDIVARNDINVITGGELNVKSVEDSYTSSQSSKKRSFSGSKKSSHSLDTKTQLSSNIVAGGDITLNSLTDINIEASNLQAQNGLIVSEVGDINIKNGIDSVKEFTTSKKRGSLSRKSSKVYDYQEYAASSNLKFGGDLNIEAELGDVNIQGSNIEVANNLNFGEFEIAKNADGSLKIKEDGTFETISGNSVQNVNITAADLKSEHWEEHKSKSYSPVNAVKQIANKLNKLANKAINPLGIKSPLDDLNKKLQEKTILRSSESGAMVTIKTNKTSSSATTKHSSNLNVGGNLSVNATENLIIEGSNILIGGDAQINANKVEIKSAEETYSNRSKEKEIALGELNARFENGSFKAGVKGSGTENVYKENGTNQKSSNFQANNILINTTSDTNIIASNVNIVNDAIVKTGGSFSVVDAKNVKNTETENSRLEVEVGVKVGNAYVDVGYAAKALAEATKNLKKATQKLSKMKKLKSQGRASQKAVDLAIVQISLATLGVATATAGVALSVANAAQAASTSYGTGMYGAVYMDTMHHTDFTTTKSSQSVGSSLIVGNNINIAANKDFNMTGSVLTSNNGDINISTREANIKAGENTFESEFGSKTTNASVSVGNNGVGLSAGYSQSDNFILSNTYTNSEVNAKNGAFNLTTKGDTNIKGGNVVANKVDLNIGGDLNLDTLQDTYEQQGSSFGINISGSPDTVSSAGISVGATEIFSRTTKKATGIIELSSNNNNLSEEQNLNNLLDSNSVKVAGKIDNQTQKEDFTFTNADFEASLTVPIDLLMNPNKVVDAVKNFDKNLMTATAGVGGTIYHVGQALSGTITGKTSLSETVTNFTQNRKAMTTSIRKGRNGDVRKGLNDSSNKSPKELTALLAYAIKPEETNILYANKGELNKNGELVLGFNDSNKQGYINLGNTASDTYNLIGTDAEERTHLVTSNEYIAESANSSAQLGWKVSNFIHNDSINNNGSSQTTWNNNYSNHPVLQYNTIIASNVPEGNRDYNSILLGGAGNESNTKKYMKSWEAKFERDGVVKPKYLPISQGGKAINAYNAIINVKGNNPYILSDNLLRNGPVNKIVSASNSDGGQRNIVGYSYGSVMGAHAALNLANAGVYVDNVGLVGSPISTDSNLYKALTSNKNIGNVARFDIPGDPFSNGINLGNVSSIGSFQKGLDTHFHYIDNNKGQQDLLSKRISAEFKKQ